MSTADEQAAEEQWPEGIFSFDLMHGDATLSLYPTTHDSIPIEAKCIFAADISLQSPRTLSLLTSPAKAVASILTIFVCDILSVRRQAPPTRTMGTLAWRNFRRLRSNSSK